MVVFEKYFSVLSLACGSVQSLTTPPRNSLVVKPAQTVGKIGPLQAAINSLNTRKGPQTIFIQPGKYVENVVITYRDPLTLIGFSRKPTSLAANEVCITVETGVTGTGGSGQGSGLWVNKDNFVMKNINITNTFANKGVALAAEGKKHAYRGCSFSGLQDTLYVKRGNQFFHNCNVEGAVDIVVGRGQSWFEACTIGVKASKFQQTITGNKRQSAKDPSGFVFHKCDIKTIGDIPKPTIYLGKPYGPFASVVFQLCTLPPAINPAGWMPYSLKEEKSTTMNINFVELSNTGKGATTTSRQFLAPPPPKPFETKSFFGGVNVDTWFEMDITVNTGSSDTTVSPPQDIIPPPPVDKSPPPSPDKEKNLPPPSNVKTPPPSSQDNPPTPTLPPPPSDPTGPPSPSDPTGPPPPSNEAPSPPPPPTGPPPCTCSPSPSTGGPPVLPPPQKNESIVVTETIINNNEIIVNKPEVSQSKPGNEGGNAGASQDGDFSLPDSNPVPA